MNNATRDFLKERCHSLFDWISPELPEDLMFNNNDKCILAVCSHEEYFGEEETIWDSFLMNQRGIIPLSKAVIGSILLCS